MPPRCECDITNITIWRPISGTCFGHQVYFCPGCSGLFTMVHWGTVEPDDEEEFDEEEFDEEDVPAEG